MSRSEGNGSKAQSASSSHSSLYKAERWSATAVRRQRHKFSLFPVRREKILVGFWPLIRKVLAFAGFYGVLASLRPEGAANSLQFSLLAGNCVCGRRAELFRRGRHHPHRG